MLSLGNLQNLVTIETATCHSLIYRFVAYLGTMVNFFLDSVLFVILIYNQVISCNMETFSSNCLEYVIS